jgi:predicted nucleic acid-binding protein
MNIFLDSSAIVKRYIEESGSSRVAEILRDAGEITICIICVPETISPVTDCSVKGKSGWTVSVD